MRGREIAGHFRFRLGDEGCERGGFIVRGLQNFFGDGCPKIKTLAKLLNVSRGIFRETEMSEKELGWAAVQNTFEGFVPYGEVNVGRRSGGHHIGAIGDADSRCVAGERDTFLRVEISHVMAGVPRGVEHVEFFIAERERFAAFEDFEVLFGDGLRFAEKPMEIVGPQAGSAGKKPGRIDEVWGAIGVDINAEAWIFKYERTGGASMVKMNVREQDGVEIGDGEPAGEQVMVEGFKGRRWTWIN